MALGKNLEIDQNIQEVTGFQTSDGTIHKNLDKARVWEKEMELHHVIDENHYTDHAGAIKVFINENKDLLLEYLHLCAMIR